MHLPQKVKRPKPGGRNAPGCSDPAESAGGGNAAPCAVPTESSACAWLPPSVSPFAWLGLGAVHVGAALRPATRSGGDQHQARARLRVRVAPSPCEVTAHRDSTRRGDPTNPLVRSSVELQYPTLGQIRSEPITSMDEDTLSSITNRPCAHLVPETHGLKIRDLGNSDHRECIRTVTGCHRTVTVLLLAARERVRRNGAARAPSAQEAAFEQVMVHWHV